MLLLAEPPTVKDVLAKYDAAMSPATFKGTATMTAHRDDGSTRGYKMTFLKGTEDKSRIWFLEPAAVRGQEMLRNGENFWLYMSDMDILLTPEVATDLFRRDLDPARYHTFERTFLPDCDRRKYHCNTFMVKHSIYWAVNGYDEDYCGTYGGDGPFLRQLGNLAPREHHDDVLLFGVERDVVPDANTDLPRKVGEFGDKYRRIFDHKRRTGDERSKNPIRFEWEEVEL
jgi:hypothetical protein